MKKYTPLLFFFLLATRTLIAQRVDTDKVNATRQYINVYNNKNEKVIKICRVFNRGMWLNEDKSTYTYDKNTNETAELIQCWYNNNWVNTYLYTYTYDKHNVQSGYAHFLWNGAQWLPPSYRIFGGIFNPRDRVKWKNDNNSWSTGIIVGSSKMDDFSVKPDADTNKILRISFHALQPVDTIEAKKVISVSFPGDDGRHTPQLQRPAMINQNGFTNKAEAKNLTVKGLKEGKWVEYYQFIVFEDGDPFKYLTTDTAAPYYKLTIYKKGKPDGMVMTYKNKENTLYSEAPYKHGKLNGLYRQYEKGYVIIETPYTDSIINGIEKSYFCNSGNLEWETPFKDGKENGVAKEYFEIGGGLSETISYKDGKFDGMKYTYYKSGKIMSETPYTAQKMHPDVHETFPENPTPRQLREHYKRPLINGTEKVYYENGNVESERPYEDGLIWEGVAREFYADGKLKSETAYNYGKIITSKRFDENGNEIPVPKPPQRRSIH